MFLSLDGTFFVQLINFAIFFAVLNYVFLRPVGRAIARRRAYIDSLTADYDAAQKTANALRSEAEQARAEARRQAELTLSRRRAEASDKATEIALEYHRRAQSVIEHSQQTVDAEVAKARAGEEPLIAALAGEMVDKALAGSARS